MRIEKSSKYAPLLLRTGIAISRSFVPPGKARMERSGCARAPTRSRPSSRAFNDIGAMALEGRLKAPEASAGSCWGMRAREAQAHSRSARLARPRRFASPARIPIVPVPEKRRTPTQPFGQPTRRRRFSRECKALALSDGILTTKIYDLLTFRRGSRRLGRDSTEVIEIPAFLNVLAFRPRL